jgi:hypothetical protein
MGLDAGAIATGIAALTITGVTVKDITAIPQQVQPRDCPVLFPSPDGWLTGSNGEPADGPATFGSASSRMWIFNRTLQYVYLHSTAGSGRGLYETIPALSDKADAIQQAILLLDLSQVDVQSVNISAFGVLTDPTGGNFYGFLVTIQLREKVNP